jgi:hypothetical protein
MKVFRYNHRPRTSLRCKSQTFQLGCHSIFLGWTHITNFCYEWLSLNYFTAGWLNYKSKAITALFEFFHNAASILILLFKGLTDAQVNYFILKIFSKLCEGQRLCYKVELSFYLSSIRHNLFQHFFALVVKKYLTVVLNVGQCKYLKSC